MYNTHLIAVTTADGMVATCSSQCVRQAMNWIAWSYINKPICSPVAWRLQTCWSTGLLVIVYPGSFTSHCGCWNISRVTRRNAGL